MKTPTCIPSDFQFCWVFYYQLQKCLGHWCLDFHQQNSPRWPTHTGSKEYLHLFHCFNQKVSIALLQVALTLHCSNLDFHQMALNAVAHALAVDVVGDLGWNMYFTCFTGFTYISLNNRICWSYMWKNNLNCGENLCGFPSKGFLWRDVFHLGAMQTI